VRPGPLDQADDRVHLWLRGDLFASALDGSPTRGSGPDGAELIAAYRRLGHGWVWRLTGQFSAVLWDAERRELALYRDDSSAATLYYHRLPSGGLVFAEALETLTRCPLVARRLSRGGLHEYLRFLDITTPNTVYDGVYSTEPGVLCLHGRHGLHQRRAEPSAAPDEAVSPASPRTLDEAADVLHRALAQAVETRIADSSPLLCFLSGGVDSAYLCALAARLRTDVTAATVGFAEEQADESSIAAAVARAIGVEHRVWRFDDREYRRAFEALAGADYPFADPAGPPTLLAFERARELAPLALDGTGADTLLGIMPARHQRLAVQYAARFPFAVRRLFARLMGLLPVVREYRPLMDFGDAQELLVRWRGWSRRELEALYGEPVSLSDTRFYRVFAQYPHHAHMERYSALMGTLPDDRIHVAAGMTGLKVRFPFFDPGVTEVVRGLAPELRYLDGEHKRVLKRGLSRLVPRALWDLPKHGFDFPFDQLLEADGYGLVHAYADPAGLARLGCSDRAGLERTVSDYLAGDRSERFRVWALVVLGAWLQRHDLSA
jgi:asparagine synthase (glutamine-hydrolysing)